MDSALGWIGDFVRWLAALFPHWHNVRATHGAVKFKFGRVEACTPGVVWFWPATTEVLMFPTARTTTNLQSQTITTKDEQPILVSAMVVYEVRDIQKLLSQTYDPEETIADLALSDIYDVICVLSWPEIRAAQQSGELDRKLREKTRQSLEKYGVWVQKAMLTDLARCRVLRLVQTSS